MLKRFDCEDEEYLGDNKEWYFRETEKYFSVQSLSRVWLFVTPWTTAPQASLSITNSRSLLKNNIL